VAAHFLDLLEAQGEPVEVLGLSRTIPESLREKPFQFVHLSLVELNLLDYRALEIAVVSCSPTRCVHLASQSSVGKSWSAPLESFLNNTNIFLNIAEIVRKNAVRCRILSVGSSEEYGNVAPEQLPLEESLPLHPVNPYAVARVSQEMLSRCYVDAYHLDIVLTRSFNHLGPGQSAAFAIPSFVRQIGEAVARGEPEAVLRTGDLSVVRDFIDVRDVARAYLALLEKGTPGELYNVCTGKSQTLQSVVALIAEIFGVQVKVEVDPARVRPNDNRVVVGSNAKIREHTGWAPQITLKESLEALCRDLPSTRA
jgi:GDP-4-dehydro-6-deoxy-D-mannose reductase